MALQTFTAGQVLTAAQVTALQANDYNQTVSTKTDSYTLVAADKGTRVVMNKATATTITVNTSLFSAGDTLWIHNVGAGVCTITAGTATVSTSGSLALAQNAGGTLYFTSAGVAIFFPTVASSAQGLTLINTTSFSAVASASLPANTFSATYDMYKIILEITNASATGYFTSRLRASGTDNTTSNYSCCFSFMSHTANSIGDDFGGASQTSFNKFSYLSSGGKLYADITLFNPFKSSETTYAGFFTTTANTETWWGGGRFNATTSFDSLTLIPSSGTITGNMSVYGVNK